MDTLLSQLLPSLTHFHYLIYWLAFLAALFETTLLLGLFLPGSTLLLFLGAYAAGGNIDIIDLWWFALAGAVLGDNVNYFLGKRYGKQWMLNGVWIIKPAHFTSAHDFFEAHGSKSVFLGRFVPTVKEIVPFIAGSAEMNRGSFFLWNVLGAMGWGLEWLGAGYLFAQSLNLAQMWLSRLGMLIMAGLLLAMLFWILQVKVIKYGRATIEFSSSIWKSVYGAVLDNEKVLLWITSHPKLSTFLRQRFDGTHFQGRSLTLLSLAFFYVLILFAGIVEDLITSDLIVALDKSVAQLVMTFRAPEVLQVFVWITELGNWQVSIPFTLIAGIILIVSQRPLLLLPLLVSIVGSESFTMLGKMAFHRPRPIEAVLYEHSYSFPSGHATIAVALYGLLGYLAIRYAGRWQIKVKLFFVSLLVIGLLGLSRIIVGVHYVSDVWSGYLVGTLWLIIAVSLTEWMVAQKKLDFHSPVSGSRKAVISGLLLVALCYYIGFAAIYQPKPAPVKTVQAIQLTENLSAVLQKEGLQFTHTLMGSPQQPVSLEIVAESDQHLLQQLHKAGWKKTVKPDINSLLQQIKGTTGKNDIPVAPAFWNGNINSFALINGQAPDPEINILYLWKTPYRIAKGHVYIGITRIYSGKKWLLLHTIKPDVDASNEKLLLSLQKMNMVEQSCEQQLVPEMTGQYLLNAHFFTHGRMLEINLLPYEIIDSVFCSSKSE